MSTELDTLRSENRRLRAILEGISRAGLGQGTLIEFFLDQEKGEAFLIVCRADRSEIEFAEEIRGELEKLASVFVSVLGTKSMIGVEAEQPKATTETPQ